MNLTARIPDLMFNVDLPEVIATNTVLPLLDTTGATILDTAGLEINVPGVSSALVFHTKMPDLRLNGDAP